jgi:hypothetical protein
VNEDRACPVQQTRQSLRHGLIRSIANHAITR